MPSVNCASFCLFTKANEKKWITEMKYSVYDSFMIWMIFDIYVFIRRKWKETAGLQVLLAFHPFFKFILQTLVHRNSEMSAWKGPASGGGASGTRMREVACPTCTVHLQVNCRPLNNTNSQIAPSDCAFGTWRINYWYFCHLAVAFQVQIPTSGSETVECGVCQHAFLVSANW